MRKMFIVIMAASLLAATDANTMPARMRNVDNKGHFSFNLGYLSIQDDTWHGLLKLELIDNLSETELKKALIGAINNNQKIIAQYFRNDVGNIHDIIMRQLTWVYGQDPDILNPDGTVKVANGRLISPEDALDVVRCLKLIHVTNFYTEGKWVVTRYAADGREPDNSSWLKIEEDDILAENGDKNNPAFRTHCLNPIIPGPTPKESTDTPSEDNTTTTETKKDGVTVTVTNTNTVNGNSNPEPVEKVVVVERRTRSNYGYRPRIIPQIFPQTYPPMRMPQRVYRGGGMPPPPVRIPRRSYGGGGSYHPRGGYQPQPNPQTPPRRDNEARPGRHQ